MIRTVLFTSLALLLMSDVAVVQAVEPDTPDEKRYGFHWIPPSGFYDDWVFLLQGFYSGLDGLGAGVEVSRPFSSPVLTKYRVSDVELVLRTRVYEGGHGELEFRADVTSRNAQWSMRTLLLHSTRLREFWGIGPDVPDSDRERYRPRDTRAYVELLRNIARLRVGLRLEFQGYRYQETESGGLLETGDYVGVSSSGEYVGGAGLVFDYDSRDDVYGPTSGWRTRGSLMAFDVFKGGGTQFLNTFLDIRTYRSTSPRNVFAFQYFIFGVNGEAPIWRYAAIGGREHTRGYSRNRYVDQKMTAFQMEWRRHLYKRLGMQFFTGTAIVTPAWSKIQIRNHHPTFGAGLSLVIPQVSNIAIRGDLAIGDESVHGNLALGLAF